MVGTSLRRLAGIVVCAGGLVTLAAVPGLADPPATDAARGPVSQAYAEAATATIAAQSGGTGRFTATHDGTRERTAGRNTPVLPVLDQQATVVGGSLGQDATAAAGATSAACAGLVGRGGAVEVGPHGRCLTDSHGRIALSLGALDQLGLADVLAGLPDLPQLPDLPDPASLPVLELRIEGAAVAAACYATSQAASGSSNLVDAEVVGIVGGQRFPIASIPSGGLSLGLDDVLARLPEVPGLSNAVKAFLDQLPADQLPSNDILTIDTDVRTRAPGRISVTALRVGVVPDTLADLRVATVSCGPNEAAAIPRTPPSPSPTPEPTGVPTAVPAGLGSLPGGGAPGGGAPSGATVPVSSSRGVGLLLPLAVFAVAGLALGCLRHRRGRTA